MTRGDTTQGGAALKGLMPLLDVVFLLLFALLALSETRTSNREERVHVRLPQVESGHDAPQKTEHRIVLEIDASSRVKLGKDGRVLSSREELDRALSSSLGETVPEDVTVEIHADREARSGTAVAMLQHLRLRGFVRVSLVATGSASDKDLLGGPR